MMARSRRSRALRVSSALLVVARHPSRTTGSRSTAPCSSCCGSSSICSRLEADPAAGTSSAAVARSGQRRLDVRPQLGGVSPGRRQVVDRPPFDFGRGIGTASVPAPGSRPGAAMLRRRRGPCIASMRPLAILASRRECSAGLPTAAGVSTPGAGCSRDAAASSIARANSRHRNAGPARPRDRPPRSTASAASVSRASSGRSQPMTCSIP